eukprot:7080172-Prymnesium_polylepis.1
MLRLPCVPKLFVVMAINYSEYGGCHSVRNCSTKGASLWQRCLLPPKIGTATGIGPSRHGTDAPQQRCKSV